MPRRLGGIEVVYTDATRETQKPWTDYKPSKQTLPKGWQRDPDRKALKEALIWEKDVEIYMRDGVKLLADIFRPARLDGQKLPALLAWSPYGKTGTGFFHTPEMPYIGVHKHQLSGLEKFEAPDPAEWCPRGYALVFPDARGCFGSEGDMAVFGSQEAKDGYDTIEWIAVQPWSNEAIALVGNSWLAILQWQIAALQPPHLRAIAPWEGIGDLYREHLCRGGIPNYTFWDLLFGGIYGTRQREDIVKMIQKYPLMNDYWEDKKPSFRDIKVPMYVLASYSTGLHTEGSIRGWKYSASPEKWLRIHATQEWFDLYTAEANDDLQRFLDHYLLGKDNGWQVTPKVRISLLRYNGPPIAFRVEDNYPPSRTKYQTLYLNAEAASLQLQPPVSESSVSYQSDSWDDDGVHFTYNFDKYTELCGFSKAKLFMSCKDLDDMDVYVIIRKLDMDGIVLVHHNIPFIHQKPGTKPEDIPDGNFNKYVGPSGRLRASKRETCPDPNLTNDMRAQQSPTELWYPHYDSRKIPVGEIVELDIAIWPGGMVFEAGESLRFEIKGYDPTFPEFPALYRNVPNQNVGRHLVHTGLKNLSQVMLPLI